MKTYKNAVDKIKASDSFKSETVQMLVDRQTNSRRFRFAPVAAIAASLALVIALGAMFFPMSGSKNSFTITANAAELNQNEFKTFGELPASGWWSNWDFDTNDFNAELTNGTRSDFMLDVEGKNIEKVTYKIEHGAFAVPDKNTRLIEKTKAPDFDYALQTKGRTLYSEISTSYDNQIDAVNDNVDVVFYTFEDTEELRNIVYEFQKINEQVPWAGQFDADKAKKNTQKFFEAVIDRCELKVTVAYSDGSTETKTVKLKTDVEVDINSAQMEQDGRSVIGDMYSVRVNLKAKLV